MLTSLLQPFHLPKTIYKTTSDLSGPIRVKKRGNELRLLVGGLTQSVYVLNNNWRSFSESYWYKAAELVAEKTDVPPQGLILGLGGGSFAHLITQMLGRFPLVGVEYDSEIIEIGNKYFDLDTLKHLEILEGDAFELLDIDSLRVATRGDSYAAGVHPRFCRGGPMCPPTQEATQQKFTFIFCDLFTGMQVTNSVEEKNFLTHVANLLTEDGIALFNWSHNYNTPEQNIRQEQFLANAKKVFGKIEADVVHGGRSKLVWGRN